MDRKRMAALKRISTVLLAALFACGRSDGQSRPVTLEKPEAMLPGSFSSVNSIIELRDGRIAFVDLKEKTFLFGDFSNQRLDTIGVHADSIAPNDSAPNKYKFPGHVIHLAGDTIALVDFAAERTMLWNEGGQYMASFPLAAVAGRNPALAFDTLGRAYKGDYRSILGGVEPGQQINLDSLPVVRFLRAGGRADTVAMLKLPPLGKGKFGEETRDVPTIFGATDVFGVLPDGSLWIARASSNSVDWLSPDGKLTRGPSQPYTKVPVTQADRDRYLKPVLEQAYQSGLPRGIEVVFPFAEFKPPFITALARSNGEVWLQRSRPADDVVAEYDVFGRDGSRIRLVRLPAGATVSGLGTRGAIYTVIREGERQRVGRFRIEVSGER